MFHCSQADHSVSSLTTHPRTCSHRGSGTLSENAATGVRRSANSLLSRVARAGHANALDTDFPTIVFWLNSPLGLGVRWSDVRALLHLRFSWVMCYVLPLILVLPHPGEHGQADLQEHGTSFLRPLGVKSKWPLSQVKMALRPNQLVLFQTEWPYVGTWV